MADILSVTPSAPTPATSGGAPQLSNAPVQQAPTTVSAPAQLTGTVVSSNPQTQQLTIQTAQGPILVQSTVALPPNTPVTVDLSASNGQMRATVTVSSQNAVQTTQPVLQPPEIQAPAPPPPLQEGTTVTALQLPAQTVLPQQTTSLPSTPQQSTPQPPPIEQLAASLDTLKETGTPNAELPLPPQQMEELFNTSDTQTFLKELPPQLLQNVADYFAAQPQQTDATDQAPGIIGRLLSAYLPQKTGADEASTPALPQSHEDDNLMQALRVPVQTKDTSSSSPPAPGNTKQASFSPLTTSLDTLLASSEETSHETSGFSAILRQLIPQHGAAAQDSSSTPQTMVRMQVVKVLPPQTTPAQAKAAMAKAPAGAQEAEVETSTSNGQPILKTASGDAHYILNMPASVPQGSKVIFTATPMTSEEIEQQGLSTSGLFTEADSTSPQNSSWPGMQEALKSLPPASAAAQVIRNTLPTPSQQLVPTSLFFLAALRSGSISNWLGTATLQALQQSTSKNAVDALSDDFDKMSTQSKDVLPGDWRSITIPMRYDQQISQMQFYVRRQNDQEQSDDVKSAGGKPATRFILNLSLTRMGALQLDGFIQKKSFDIILRTEDKLPFDMRQELMKRFAQGLDQVQMQGGISFQTRQQGWMVPEVRNTSSEA